MNSIETQDPALARIVDQVLSARARQARLDIRGGATKRFYGGEPSGEPLDLRALTGVSSYEPSELVVTVRAGQPLAELEALLADCGQCLPFEPPRFAPGGTVGGMVAAGLAGPARAAVGGVRDYILGATVLNGQGQVLTFGGQVMKNVAGYDVSRALAGSLGVLGAILEVSLKVLPRAPAFATLALELDQPQALKRLARWAGQPLPLHASAWHQGRLLVRLAGARAAVAAATQVIGGSVLDAHEAAGLWAALRDQHHPFFALDSTDPAEALWRLSVPATTPPLSLAGETLIEWGGAQRWLRSRAPASELRAEAERAGGHATLFRGGDRSAGVFTPLPAVAMRIQRDIKRAFDPDGLFNPGRLYPDL